MMKPFLDVCTTMQLSDTLLKLAIEPEEPAPLKEVVYKGTCIGEPCFILDSKDSPIGKCEKTGAYIYVELAKRQKLCDYEQSRYSSKKPSNNDKTPTTKPTKTPSKKHS